MTDRRDPYDLLATILEQLDDDRLTNLIVKLEQHDDRPRVSILECAVSALLAARNDRASGRIRMAIEAEHVFDQACYQYGRYGRSAAR